MTETQGNRDVLLEILKWTKFQGMLQVKQILETNLDTDTKKLVYELSDGRSSPDIAKKVNVTAQTVRDYWKAWALILIVELHPEYKKRYCKIFSLKDVGIVVPANAVSSNKGVSNEETDGKK